MLPESEEENSLAPVYGAYLVFLFYFWFQALLGNQGYQPYRQYIWLSYPWKTALASILFFGPLLFVLSKVWAFRLTHYLTLLIAVLVVLYFGIIISARPELDVINDRSHAILLATDRLFEGQFPYSEQTHLGNPITILTGTMILGSIPAFLFDRPELASIPLLLIGLFFLAHLKCCTRGEITVSLFIPVGLVFLNPGIVQELALGSDLFWGSLLLTIAAIILYSRKSWIFIPFLVLALSTRASMAPIALLWLVSLYQFFPKGTATKYLFIVVSVVGVLHLPFLLWEPDTYLNFAPLGVSKSKLLLPFPEGDNLLADIFNILIPGGAVRYYTITVFLLMAGAFSGLLVKDVVSLLAWSVIWLTVPQFFMSEFHLLDYLCQAVFPLAAMMLIPAGEEELDSD